METLSGGILSGEGVLDVQWGNLFFRTFGIAVVFSFLFWRTGFSQGFAASPHNFNISNLTSL